MSRSIIRTPQSYPYYNPNPGVNYYQDGNNNVLYESVNYKHVVPTQTRTQNQITDYRRSNAIQKSSVCTCGLHCTCASQCTCGTKCTCGSKCTCTQNKPQKKVLTILQPIPENVISQNSKVSIKPVPKKTKKPYCPEDVDNLKFDRTYETTLPEFKNLKKQQESFNVVKKFITEPDKQEDLEIIDPEKPLCQEHDDLFIEADDRPNLKWNETNEPIKSTKLQVEEPHKPRWNEVNEPVKETKMLVKKAYPQWNEANKESTEQEYTIPPRRIVLRQDDGENFELPKCPRFRGEMEEENDEYTALAKPKEENIPAVTGKFAYPPDFPRPDWNETNRPMQNRPLELPRAKEKAELVPTRVNKVALKGKMKDWNKTNDTENEISVNITRKPKRGPYTQVRNEPHEIKPTPVDWNKVNEEDKAKELTLLRHKNWPLIIEDGDKLKIEGEPEEVIVNDDYHAVDIPKRNIKANIMKMKDEEEEIEESESIDPFQNIKPHDGIYPDLNSMITANEPNINIKDDGRLKSSKNNKNKYGYAN